jgi:cob(I)alamin adenosyltransferase
MDETQSTSEQNSSNVKSKGLVIINTGDGKGKTTAALGLMMRAWGNGMKVIMLQFVKKAGSNYGEHKAAGKMGIEILSHGAGFTFGGKNVDENSRLSLELWETSKEIINSGRYSMVVLDELTYPLKFGWLSTNELIAFLQSRNKAVHVVITGRDAPQELIDFADLVTEMKEIKHQFHKGIKAQKGIEF